MWFETFLCQTGSQDSFHGLIRIQPIKFDKRETYNQIGTRLDSLTQKTIIDISIFTIKVRMHQCLFIDIKLQTFINAQFILRFFFNRTLSTN